MKTWQKAALCVALSFMCLFTCVGYALISRNMSITGGVTVEAAEPEGLYIKSITVVSSSGVAAEKSTVILPTNVQSACTVRSVGATVTYEITVHNMTDMTYWYLGTSIATEAGSNHLIGKTNGISITTRDGASNSSTPFDTSDWVPPQTERTFYATYTFGSNAQGDITTLVNFSFGLHVASVSDAFLNVLNDKASPYGYSYLTDAFNQNYKQNGSTVIANLGDDQEVFNNLFGASLGVNVNGETLPVTIVVERKDVDGKPGTGDAFGVANGPSGCEYTVYISVDDLSQSGKATVYAVSYTCGADGTWYMIGELYEGTCPTEQYENSANASDRAFDVDEWHASPKEYTVVGKVSYLVASGGEIYDMWTEIEQLMGEFDQSLINDINNSSDVKQLLTGAARTVYTFRKNNGQQVQSPNTENAANPGYEELKRAFDRMMPYCILDNFDSPSNQARISDKVRELSRAELIRLLEDLQAAYEYYLAVNS